MRLAYADPPYLGCAHLYKEHPQSKMWNLVESHVQLMKTLDSQNDGWALSASAPSLARLLPHAPEGARVAVWVKPFAAFKRNVRIAYTWEPVIFSPARAHSAEGAAVTRDHLSHVITLRRGLTGAKPPQFCRWVLDLMGYVDGDEVIDLFPGTGVMSRVVAQGTLAVTS